ncbi:ninein isoform X1 [Hemibagrus wyckioides]|uniref:ninein isoform X1 n=1 Tax=Hemibagrus wyckioides TaxID=337641 RepID=UPI00266C873E|nr:ninein isoform X1 [Hemibagrus wyckioides]XP_058242013.1 ninein isoform X1 [Hemibagrus wyckioides]XP_058242014.1 ninein isoform X1 [Hemibagrus wyckioides]
MDGEGDQRDQHEERLREVFQSFDGSGAGSLSPEELTELCHALQLADQALHTLLETLFQTEDQINTRVEFEQFKDALILVLSSNEETLAKENPPRPEVQPRFVKGTKRYGRRSTPEFTHSNSDLEHTPSVEREEEDATRTSDGTLPVKRERWNADVSSAEEYEAEGQLHLWNPDEPGTPRGSMAPLSDLEERLYSACQQLSLPLHGTATLQQLRTLCQHLDLEVGEEVFQSAHEKNVSVLEFVSCIQTDSKPPTPSASTPYRQLKRHHSTQPFDEMGRRISTAMSSTIGLRLFSELDDGTGHTAVELLLDAWLEDGVQNSSEILQALDFNLERKVNLSELTAALENELMVTKNSIHQAALASFKAEIRYLLERVDLELREKEKLHSDLEKAEKLKSQLASEVDEHHSTIERNNNLNLRKLEQEHKDRMVALKAELSKEVELVQQQASQQREELELEISRVREDETFLRERLTLTLKENGRLEAELLDSTERLMEVEAQLNKLQKNLDNVLREKFGDLDLGNAEFYQQEERLRQLRNSYEEQCRELQDRIDELQAQLEDFRSVSRAPQTSLMPSLSDELDSKSPGMESDQGLGSEEGQPFNLSLEAEMMLEQLKEQHIRELEDIREQLDSTVNKCEHRLEEQKTSFEEERSLLSLQHQQEVKAIREELNKALERARDLQERLEQERCSMEAQQSVERAELHAVYQQQVDSLSQEVQDARIQALKLEEQLKLLEEQEESSVRDKEELSKAHAEELSRMELHYTETLKASLQKQKGEAENTLTEELKKERRHLEEVHEEVLRVQLEEVQQRAEQERVELERRLREEWECDKQQLEESNRKKLQEELDLMQSEQEESSKRFRAQWEKEHMLLQEQHHTELQKCLQQERERLQVQEEDKERRMIEEWEKERVQLHEQHEGVLQARLEEQRAQFQAQGKEQERTWQKMLEEHRVQMEHAHREAMEELSVKHSEEREMLSCMLEKLHADIAKERNEAGRLAEENLLLKQSISELREDDLKEKQQELLLKVEHFRKEKNAAQKMADGLKRQISELRRRRKQLEQENNALSQQNAKHVLSVDALQHNLEEVMLHHGNGSFNERSEIEEGDFAASHSKTEKLEEEKKLLRAELNHCVEKMAQLRSAETQLAQVLQERQMADKHNQALRTQMIKAQEKVQAVNFTLQELTQQNSRLKSDLRITQQERDTLKQEVISLHKQLQNANEKCRPAEMSVSGIPGSSHQGKRVWPELSRLMEAELNLLREENQRLQREISDARLELSSAHEKTRQLEALVLSVKQQKLQNQARLAKTAEQERSALRREIEALHTQLHNKSCDSKEEQREFEKLHEENERLRNKQTIIEAQLMEAQLLAMLPPSPLRMSAERRGQPRGDDMNPDINKEKEMALLKMEERMKEVELTLRNVKLLLQEKVSQLKEQMNKNSKADVLIKDLYVENAHLLKALEVSEQRQKVTEKKNYLLEEKISSLNKIVRELSPSPLMPVPYHVTRS